MFWDLSIITVDQVSVSDVLEFSAGDQRNCQSATTQQNI